MQQTCINLRKTLMQRTSSMAPSGVYHACSIAQLYYEFLPSTVDFRRYNLFCDESVVQRRSWPVDYVLSLSYFSAVDVFFSDGFHCEVDWSVGLCRRRPCWRIYRPSCAPAIDWTSDSTICEASFSPRLCDSHTMHVPCMYTCDISSRQCSPCGQPTVVS